MALLTGIPGISSVGTLTDDDISTLSQRGLLIESGFTTARLKQACYELTASAIYYDLANGQARHALAPGEYILVKPRQFIVVITAETLNIPDDVLGRILTKGVLFSAGLLPVNTYADPGFYGQLGIVFFNASNEYLRLEQGDPIAKIEFSRLEKPVTTPYHGQHGYQTQMWPIPTHLVLSEADRRSDPRIGTGEEELVRSYGPEVAGVVKRIAGFERYLILATVAYLTFTAMLFIMADKSQLLPPLVSVGLGLLSNVVFAVLTWFATSLTRR